MSVVVPELHCSASRRQFVLARCAQDLLAGWERGRTGGYNHGAMFVSRRHGLLVKGHSSYDIPPGALAKKSDQLASGPRTVEYMCALFTLDGLASALARHLDALGYSQRLHRALTAIRDHQPSEADIVLVTNAIVTGKRAREEQDEEDLGAADNSEDAAT